MARLKRSKNRAGLSKRAQQMLDAISGVSAAAKRAEREEYRQACADKKRKKLAPLAAKLIRLIGVDPARSVLDRVYPGARTIADIPGELLGALGTQLSFACRHANRVPHHGAFDARKEREAARAIETGPALLPIEVTAPASPPSIHVQPDRDGRPVAVPELPPVSAQAPTAAEARAIRRRVGHQATNSGIGGFYSGMALMAETVFQAGGSRFPRDTRRETPGREHPSETYDRHFNMPTIYEK